MKNYPDHPAIKAIDDCLKITQNLIETFDQLIKEEGTMTEWTKTEDEYPPCDGWYWTSIYATTNKFSPDIFLMRFDGSYFIYSGRPVEDPNYWKPYPVREKRYGKRNK